MSMHPLLLPFTPRFIVLTLCVAATALLGGLLYLHPSTLYGAAIPLALFGGLSALGVRDLFQTRHAVLRNYPIAAHLRFLLEDVRQRGRELRIVVDDDDLTSHDEENIRPTPDEATRFVRSNAAAGVITVSQRTPTAASQWTMGKSYPRGNGRRKPSPSDFATKRGLLTWT